MTAPRRARRDDGGGGGGAGGALAGAATLRGGLLIGVAVIIGVLLLGKGFDSGFLPSSSNDPSDHVATGGDNGDTDTGDGEGTTTSTTAAITHAPAEVHVQVLNGGGPSGSAKAATDELIAASYATVPGDDAAQHVAASIIYAAAGYESDAGQIGQALGITAAPQAMPTTPPAPATAEQNVVVVLGPDFTPPS